RNPPARGLPPQRARREVGAAPRLRHERRVARASEGEVAVKDRTRQPLRSDTPRRQTGRPVHAPTEAVVERRAFSPAPHVRAPARRYGWLAPGHPRG